MSKAEDTLLKLLRSKPTPENEVTAKQDNPSPAPPPTKRSKLQDAKRSDSGLTNVPKQQAPKRVQREPVSKRGTKSTKTTTDRVNDVREQFVSTPVPSPSVVDNNPIAATPHVARMRSASRTPNMTGRNREETEFESVDGQPGRNAPSTAFSRAYDKQRNSFPNETEDVPVGFEYDDNVGYAPDLLRMHHLSMICCRSMD